MTPRQQVAELYNKYPQSTTFKQDINYYFKHGYVCDTPLAFAMGKPIKYEWGDAWFIHSATGDLKTILTFLPYELPYVVFARRGKRPKAYNLKRVMKLCKTMTCLNGAGLATE